MNPFRPQLDSVLEALRIELPARFFWYGRSYEERARQDPVHRASLLTHALHDHLYLHFYCSGTAVPYANDWDLPFDGRGLIFSRALSEANDGRGFWDRGWRCQVVASTWFGLSKGLLSVAAPQESCRAPDSSPILVGDPVRLWQPKESFHRSPGYYVAFSDEPLTDESGTVRIYWNADPSEAIVLVRVLTNRLNRMAIPFQLKALDNPSSYGRCDAVVLYLRREDYSEFREAVAPQALTAVGGRLTDVVPALTKRVATGVGVAEEPQQTQSFGSHRCLLLAEALVECARMPLNAGERAIFVEDHLRSAGVDPTRPYLTTSSSDDYDLIVEAPPARTPTVDRPRAAGAGVDGALQAAHDIGMSLINGAVWHHGRCNWIGALGTASSTSIGTRHGSMGCDVYGGTSGIAWFLAELFDATEDEVFRQGALGAIRRSLLDSSSTHPTGEGFYTGVLGTAAVAARLAILLDCDELADQGLAVGRSHIAPSTGFDLMSGNAGATVAYLLLYQGTNDDMFLDLAVAAGERMISGAAALRGGLSWASPSLPGRRALTGLSHGAAGAAYALIALFEASGQTSFRLAAESAMEYERSWFDPRTGNWPDFREVPDTAPAATRFPYATTWCHGAPGIALSRIHAAEVLSETSYVVEASVALRTTRNHLANWSASGRGNYSLCHGIAGNAEALLAGQHSRLDFAVSSADAVSNAASAGLERYAHRGASWPCGVHGGQNPSLMLGLAGIGLFYLRMEDDAVPSPLTPLGVTNWGHNARARRHSERARP